MERTASELLHAHWDRERFPIFNLQLPIPNWVAIENWEYWELKITRIPWRRENSSPCFNFFGNCSFHAPVLKIEF